MNVRRMAGFALLALVVVGSRDARAALVAYDGFDYAPAGSDLNGKNGGSGFSGAWAPGGFNAVVNDNFDVAAGSLAFQQLLTGGNRVSSAFSNAIAGLTRNLASPLGTPGQTQYVSVLLRPEGTLNQGNSNGFLGLVLESPTEPEVFFGKPGGGAINQYVVEDRGGPGQFASNTPAVVNQTALLVLKAQFTQQNDVFTLYVNPTPGGPEPASGVVKNNSNLGTVNGLTIYSTGAFSIDEIRVGDTFADVTPVPEPSSAAAVGVSSLLLARRRPRRRLGGA